MSLLPIEQGATMVTLSNAIKDITAVQHDIKGINTEIELDENISVVYTHFQPRTNGTFTVYDLVLLTEKHSTLLSDRVVIACTEIKYPEENSSHSILKREILAWVVYIATGSYSRQKAEPSMIHSKISHEVWLASEAFNKGEQYQIIVQNQTITIDNQAQKFIILATDLINETLLSFDQLKSFVSLFMISNTMNRSLNIFDTTFFSAFAQIFKKAFAQGLFTKEQKFDVALCLGAILPSIKTPPIDPYSCTRKPVVLTPDQEDQLLLLLQQFFKQPSFSASTFCNIFFSKDDCIDVPTDYLILCLNNLLKTLKNGTFSLQTFKYAQEIDSGFCINISFFNNHFMRDIELKKVPIDIRPVDVRTLPFLRFFYAYHSEFEDFYMQDISQETEQTPLSSFLEKMMIPVEQQRKMLTLFSNLTEDLEFFDGESGKHIPIRSEIVKERKYDLDLVCSEFKRFLTITEKAYISFIQSRTLLRKNPELKKFLLDFKPLFWLEINIEHTSTHTSLKEYIDASIHVFKLQMRRFFDDSFLRLLTQYPLEQIKSMFELFEEGRGFFVEQALKKLQLTIILKIGIVTDSIELPKSSMTTIDQMIEIVLRYQNCLNSGYSHLKLNLLTQPPFNLLRVLEYVTDLPVGLKKLIEIENTLDHEMIPSIIDTLMLHTENILQSYLGYEAMRILIPKILYYDIHKTILHYALAIERGIITVDQYCSILENNIKNNFNDLNSDHDFNEDLTDLIFKIIGRYLSNGKVSNLAKLIEKA